MGKIALIGAGGVIFARNFLKDLLTNPGLKGTSLTMMDISAERLENARRMFEVIARAAGRASVEVECTTSLRTALEGANYVVTIFRCGTMEHQRLEHDIPARYGVDQVVGDTLNPGGVFKVSNDIMDNPGDAKYGMTREQLTQAFKILKEKGAKEFGIHAFLASNTVTNDYYPMLSRILFEIAVELQQETGCHIKFINLSGGVGIPYRPEQEPNDIRAIGEGVRKVYEEVLVPAGMGDVALYTELGRFMTGPYGCLVTRAIHEKHTYKEYIGVDASAVNLIRPAMYGAYHHISVVGKEDLPCDHKYDVTGSLCENNDKFAIDRMLPEIEVGDLLVIHDTGAHGFSMGYNYNGKLKSAEVLLKEDGTTQLIRRAETPADYFATFDCFEIGQKLLKECK